MSRIRIIAGGLKGRVIPFSNKKFDDADITPQKVKGAVFSMIGEWLEGKGFLDLYAGSGQIGLEALSRGADPVVLNEPDARRFHFITSYLDGLDLATRPLLLNLTDQKALDHLKSLDITAHYIFLDPPYNKIKNVVVQHWGIIQKISDSGILRRNGKIIIQHFSANILDEKIGPYHLRSTKKYGRTSLSVYS